jgi:hypothetical protein
MAASHSRQVPIVHPGGSRNPDEAGLGECNGRAEPFL